MLAEGTDAPLVYRMFRALARLALPSRLGLIRALGPVSLPESGPVIVVVGRAARFEDVLLMVAAFERRVRCLVSPSEGGSAWRSLWLRALDQIVIEPDRASLEPALEAVAAGDVVVIFEPTPPGGTGETSSSFAAELVLEAESPRRGLRNVAIFPAYLFVPPASLGTREVLVYLSAPLSARQHASEPDRARRAQALSRAIRQRLTQNTFCLAPQELEQYAAELEEVLREDLREEWAGLPGRAEALNEFELSGLIRQWMDETNSSDPTELVALRHRLDAYRRERQRWALARFGAETASSWLDSFPARASVAAETLLGFLPAVFGLVNHLFVGLVLHFRGLLKREPDAEDANRWAKRVGIVLAFYTVQILLIAKFFGRAAAGYYAAALPLSGAYLWRYAWLFRHRTRLLLISARLSFVTPLLRARRRTLVGSLSRARDRFAEALEIPHP